MEPPHLAQTVDSLVAQSADPLVGDFVVGIALALLLFGLFYRYILKPARTDRSTGSGGNPPGQGGDPRD